MKVAIPVWNHRVSPVFDTAQKLLIFQDTKEEQLNLSECMLAGLDFYSRIELMEEQGIEILICGAISGPLEHEIWLKGIKVISYICGDVEEVYRAFRNKQLAQERFIMPGCRGRSRYQHRYKCQRRKER